MNQGDLKQDTFLIDKNIPFGIVEIMKTKPPLKKSEKTRRFIIEKTAPLFNKKGIAGTTLSDLTRETGLTKGSIYGNFRDKNEVAIAVFQHNIANLERYLAKNLEQKKSNIEKLLGLTEAYRNLYRSMVAFGGCPVANTAIEADDTHHSLREMVTEAIAHLKSLIKGLLEDGKRSCEVQHLVDSEKLANIIVSLIEGGIILAKATGQKAFFNDSCEQIDHLIRSVQVRE